MNDEDAMLNLESDWVRERTEAIGKHCQQLVISMGNAVVDGKMNVGMEKAQELGRIIGLLAGRAYTLQEAFRVLEADNPDLARGLAKLIDDTQLPTESG